MKSSKYSLNPFLIFFFFCTIVFLSSCNSSGTVSPPPAASDVSTTDLTARLSAHFIQNPTTQPERDQNAIVGYAIDQNINVTRTASGMYYQILTVGNGTSPEGNSKIKAHYKGQLFDGKVFDSSYKRGKPLEFRVPQVIRGWQEALQLLKPGGKGIFLIPSRLAYGANGFGHDIPPHAPLRFEVELLSVE